MEEEVYVELTVPQFEVDQLVKAAEKKGYERGKSEAESKIAEDGAHVLAKETEKLVANAAELLLKIDGELDRIEKDSVGLSFLIARRFAAHLVAREPLGEVVALISECLGPLRRAPMWSSECANATAKSCASESTRSPMSAVSRDGSLSSESRISSAAIVVWNGLTAGWYEIAKSLKNISRLPFEAISLHANRRPKATERDA
ncbi:hypothetical protein [Breoghania sp.]|uniref:FliH/SctL family protein n=1 Tax=Breoghania sp. TaxID=2065378 RepID=UPI002612242B|nr:hypothetical protein [Breoghania sp.]MDJ0931599.1 hypothetical protein [Breoghania sp.]